MIDNYIKDVLALRKNISVAELMTMAMHAYKQSYYMQNQAIGPEHDFITAPDISQTFGEMIAVWLMDAWMQLGQGPVSIVELGPGRGTLMRDILKTIHDNRCSRQHACLWSM